MVSLQKEWQYGLIHEEAEINYFDYTLRLSTRDGILIDSYSE